MKKETHCRHMGYFFQLAARFFYMHHPTDRIIHTTAFVTPVMEHWLEWQIAQLVHPMKDRSDDPSHHERTLLPRSYISLLMMFFFFFFFFGVWNRPKIYNIYHFWLAISPSLAMRMVPAAQFNLFTVQMFSSIFRINQCSRQMDYMAGCNGWVQWLGTMAGYNGWVQWLGAMAGCNGWVQWLGAMAGCNGWVQWLGAVAGCSGWVQWLGAVAGCNGWVQWLGAMAGCSGWVQWLGAVAGCNGWVQWLGVMAGCNLQRPGCGKHAGANTNSQQLADTVAVKQSKSLILLKADLHRF